MVIRVYFTYFTYSVTLYTANSTGLSLSLSTSLPSEKKKIVAEQIKMSRDIKRQLERNKGDGIDWAKFKDTPSVVNHFAIVAIYGLACHLASSSRLAVFALTVLVTVHVIWFAVNSR